MSVRPRPIIKVYVLSDKIGDVHLARCRTELLRAATAAFELEASGQNSVAVLFVRSACPNSDDDCVIVEIDLPVGFSSDPGAEDATARLVGQAVQRSFPNTAVQCKVYNYDPNRGFWTTLEAPL